MISYYQDIAFTVFLKLISNANTDISLEYNFT